ncbi:MAG: T9SS type A sorting domain-containing protein, partial [Bacteroidota bacterium]
PFTSISFPKTFVSVDENTGFENFMVYPNPVSNFLTVDCAICSENISFKIFTINGQEVHHENSNNSHTEIAIPHLQPGFYFLEIISEERKSVMKFIKT